MNSERLKVVFRTNDTFLSARLELECQRAFAVIFENETRNPKAVAGPERMEMDIRFLQKINESEYLYQKLVDLPERSRSGPARIAPASDRDVRSEQHWLGR